MGNRSAPRPNSYRNPISLLFALSRTFMAHGAIFPSGFRRAGFIGRESPKVQQGRSSMIFEYVLSAIVIITVAGYLIFALLRPERF